MNNFSQKFSMPYEIYEGVEFKVNFTAYFEREFKRFNFDGTQDIYGDFYVADLDFDNPAQDTKEIRDLAIDWAESRMNEPEPIENY